MIGLVRTKIMLLLHNESETALLPFHRIPLISLHLPNQKVHLYISLVKARRGYISIICVP